MIAMHGDCLVFRTAGGEGLPLTVEMLTAEMLGESALAFDPEFIRHAAQAVFHYFKHELGWKTVTVGEFTDALEKVLRGFSLQAREAPVPAVAEPHVAESDLCRLAAEAGGGGELLFFPRLRTELRWHLQHGPRIVRFRGLRRCVKQLAGARRWTPRCRELGEQIVVYLRECLDAETTRAKFALLVD